MKRLISISLVIVLVFSFVITSSADNSTSSNQIEIDDFTVIFEENTVFTKEEQQALAQIIVSPNNSDTNSQTYGVMCTLFGHKTTTETIEVVEHCVRDSSPRCLKSYCNLTVCSRCDYTVNEVVGSIYIDCCA